MLEGQINISKTDKSIAMLCEIFVALILLFPFRFQWLKLSIGILIIVLSLLSKRFYLARESCNWTIAYVILNLLLIGHGIVAGNPAPMYYFPIYVLWPIYYVLLSGCVNAYSFSKIVKTGKICMLMHIFVGLIAFIKFNLGSPDGSFWGYVASIRPGFPFLAITWGNIAGFIFMYFFFLGSIIQTRARIRKADWLILLLGLVYIFVTSRRVIFLCVVLSVIIAFYFVRFFPEDDKRQMKRRLGKITMMGCLSVGFLLLFVSCFHLFTTEDMKAFSEQTGQVSDGLRKEQIKALLEGWSAAPWFGVGTGIDASVSRSDIPGNYELTYLAKLFEGGLVGFLYYCCLILYIYIWFVRFLKDKPFLRSYAMATLVAITMFLLANATNPYLGAFDYMWVLYIPFMLINIGSSPNEAKLCG